MSRWIIALLAVFGCTFLLVLLGCGQSSPPASRSEQAADAATESGAPQSEYDVRVAKAESRQRQPVPAGEAPPDQSTRPESSPVESVVPGQLPRERGVLPLDDPGAAALDMPKVVLSEAHAATCLAKVGDSLPDFELDDLAGQRQSLVHLLGQKLTVVVFWNGKRPTSLEELADCQRQILARFADHGVAVVGINSGDEPQQAAELVEMAAARFVNLSDPHGAALQLVATAHLPRTYLVDSAGKVVWLDLEYSPTTRRDLAQAIRYSLSHE